MSVAHTPADQSAQTSELSPYMSPDAKLPASSLARTHPDQPAPTSELSPYNMSPIPESPTSSEKYDEWANKMREHYREWDEEQMPPGMSPSSWVLLNSTVRTPSSNASVSYAIS
jgi:hypothetical protein